MFHPEHVLDNNTYRKKDPICCYFVSYFNVLRHEVLLWHEINTEVMKDKWL